MKESIKRRAMRRVMTVYYLKKVFNMVTLRMGILVLMTLAFGSLVHVAAVFSNMPQLTDLGALIQFGFSAFFNTGIAVQCVVLSLGVLTLWLARDMFKVLHIPIVKLSHA
jgi:hypothetical protein